MSDYDKGGFTPPAVVIGAVEEGELILTAADWERLKGGSDAGL